MKTVAALLFVSICILQGCGTDKTTEIHDEKGRLTEKIADETEENMKYTTRSVSFTYYDTLGRIISRLTLGGKADYGAASPTWKMLNTYEYQPGNVIVACRYEDNAATYPSFYDSDTAFIHHAGALTAKTIQYKVPRRDSFMQVSYRSGGPQLTDTIYLNYSIAPQ